MKLSEVLKGIDLATPLQNDIDIKELAYHSGKVEKDSLFFCIKGYKTDGHKYLAVAKEMGAIASIVEHIQPNIDILQIPVTNSRIALAKAASNFYGNPSSKMNLIGITATNGKTSTSFMVNSIIETAGNRTGLIGTVIVKNGNITEPSDLTTPESLDLQKFLFDMNNNQCSFVTMEVSSSAMELHRADSVDFDVVALNNISREHIDLHGSFENYLKVKSDLIKKAKQNSFAILNSDDVYSSSLAEITNAKVITFSVENSNGNISVSELDLSSGTANFQVNINNPEIFEKFNNQSNFKVHLSVPGYHSVYNSMSAIAITLALGIDINHIIEGLKKFNGVERRFECIYDNLFKIFDDHFANIGNIDVTMNTLTKMNFSKLHLVYAIRGSRGKTVNYENAITIVKWAKKLGLKEITATLSKDFVNEKDTVTDEEIFAFNDALKNSNIKVNFEENLKDAVKIPLDSVSNNDVILLAGCQGMDYGADIILREIKKRNPNLNSEKHFAPLKNRVAGIIKE